MTPRALTVGLIGDRDDAVTAHRAIPVALKLAAESLGTPLEYRWLPTDQIPSEPVPAAAHLAGLEALWCVPASPYRGTAGALAAIAVARTAPLPFFGSCGGFQHALLEIARDALHLSGAAHAELEPAVTDPVIAPLSCSMVEVTDRVHLEPGSRLAQAYGASEIREGYHCNYGLNPVYQSRLEAAGVRITARDDAGEARAFELDGHPFFVGTLFQPERRALQGEAPPPAVALLAAALAARPAGLEVRAAVSAADLDAVRALFRAYGDSLGADAHFTDFEAEVFGLPGAYAGPSGALLLATVGGAPAGCVAVRPLDSGVCEMKRLFLRPGYRGMGLGFRLASRAIEVARMAGHRAMRLDTLPSMSQAHALYHRLGFRDIPAYRFNPVAGTRYLELALTLG